MSQLSTVAKELRNKSRRTRNPAGVAAESLAESTGLSLPTIARKIEQLRQEGKNIYDNYRVVGGRKKRFYRLDLA